jgi:hypothetical protein
MIAMLDCVAIVTLGVPGGAGGVVSHGLVAIMSDACGERLPAASYASTPSE